MATKAKAAKAKMSKTDWALLLLEPNLRAVAQMLADEDPGDTGLDDELAHSILHTLDRLAAYRKKKRVSVELLRALNLPDLS